MEPSEQVRQWATEQFNTTGGSIDRLTTAALDRFCQDQDFVRAFVLENLRAEILCGVTGLVRTRSGQADTNGGTDVVISEHLSELSGPVGQGPEPIAAPAVNADRPPSRAAVAKALAKSDGRPAWAKALMVDPERKNFRPLLALTREEILDGAQYLGIRSEIMRGLAGRLKPGQKVQDVIRNEAELNQIITDETDRALRDAAGDRRKSAAVERNPLKRLENRPAPIRTLSGPQNALEPAMAGAGKA